MSRHPWDFDDSQIHDLIHDLIVHGPSELERAIQEEQAAAQAAEVSA